MDFTYNSELAQLSKETENAKKERDYAAKEHNAAVDRYNKFLIELLNKVVEQEKQQLGVNINTNLTHKMHDVNIQLCRTDSQNSWRRNCVLRTLRAISSRTHPLHVSSTETAVTLMLANENPTVFGKELSKQDREQYNKMRNALIEYLKAEGDMS